MIVFCRKMLPLFHKTAVTKTFRNAQGLKVRKIAISTATVCNGLQWSIFVHVVTNFILNKQSAPIQLTLLTCFISDLLFFQTRECYQFVGWLLNHWRIILTTLRQTCKLSIMHELKEAWYIYPY